MKPLNIILIGIGGFIAYKYISNPSSQEESQEEIPQEEVDTIIPHDDHDVHIHDDTFVGIEPNLPNSHKPDTDPHISIPKYLQ